MGPKYLKLLLKVFVHSKHFIKGKKYAFVLFPSIYYLLRFANMIIAAAAKSLQSCPTLCDPVAAHQALLSLGFSRQEHWSGLPFPSPI